MMRKCLQTTSAGGWTTVLLISLMVLPLVLLGQESSSTSTSSSSRTFTVKETSDAHLFEPSAAIRVSAPTVFPKPTDKIMNIDQHHRPDEVKPMIRPVLGRHRAHCDAILAYAEGYPLPVYMMFLETLRATGFTGDVVLAIADASIVREQVIPYLTTLALATDAVADDGQMHVVVYQLAMDCDSIDGKVGRNILPRSGDTDAFQMCRLNHVYGWDDGTMAPDPRLGRVVATLRYEWYWIWSLRYQANSWLLLLDSRDSFFQSNPFADLPRTVLDPEGGMTEGLLYFFGENASATRLGISTKNRRWISVGYGERTMEAIQEKPTICSGSTMGERIAIETYLRAMVNEHDEANVRMTGSDQGFHNYLYYSGKLRHASTIRRIVVWEQGMGIVNNLGAMRTKPLVEWGMYDPDSHVVYQWDGVTPSPVVHQLDRDQHLGRWMGIKKQKEWENEWNSRKR